MPRGGRRPGAGAPRGNVNALTHGLHSRQLRQVVEELARSPSFRAVLARFGQLAAQQRTARKKEHAATVAVAAWLRYTGALGGENDGPGPAPPPLTKQAVRLLAKRLAGETIVGGRDHHTRNAPNEDIEL